MNVFTKLSKYSYDKDVYDINYNEIQIEDRGESVLKTLDCEFLYCYIDDSFEKSGFLLASNSVYKFTDGTYGVLELLISACLPIDESHFKRPTAPYLYRYPEGKTDESYTVKDHCQISFDENGSEEVTHRSIFINYGLGVSRALKGVQFLKELKFENGIEHIEGGILEGLNSYLGTAPIESIFIPSSVISMWAEYSGNFSCGVRGLNNLKEYVVDEDNTVFKSVNGALLSKDGKILYSMPCKIGETYSVPDGVEMIEVNAFTNAKNMTINIPASVKTLGAVRRPVSIFNDSSDITLNVSSKTEIRDIFEGLPELAENRGCLGITVNFVD